MQNKYNWPLWHWHIESSSICSLKCPRCPRLEVPESLIQKQLGLQFFKKTFDSVFPSKLSFCGDDGDPIYTKELIEIVKFFKNRDPTININIVTNGSYKKESWWKDLALSLNHYDEVHFSIDGWDQVSNNKYRVNSDWDSIVLGIKTLRQNSNCKMIIDTIIFSFNEANLHQIKAFALEHNFDQWQITKSTKFGSKYPGYLDNNGIDSLEPSIDNVAKFDRFTRELVNLSNKTFEEPIWIKSVNEYYTSVKNNSKDTNILPLCLIGTKGLFINSQGYFIPCCWVGNRYNHTGLEQFLKPEFNLNENSLEDVLNNPYWKIFFENTHSMRECNTKCLKSLVNEEYATRW